MFENNRTVSINPVVTAVPGGCAKGAPATLELRNRQDAVNEFFRSNADYWREIYRAEGVEATIYRERLSAVLKLAARLQLPQEARILEVGSGAGLATVELARCGYNVHAIDAVPDMVARTRRAAVEAGVERQVEAHTGDVRRLNFVDDLFQLVLAVGVLPWVIPFREPLSEMARVIEPGGHLILTVDNAWRLNHIFDPRCFPAFRPLRWKARDGLERLGLLNPASSQPRHALCTIREMDQAISSVGLRKVVGLTLGFGPFTFLGHELFSDALDIRIHRILQGLADRGIFPLRSCGVEYIVLCKKPRTAS